MTERRTLVLEEPLELWMAAARAGVWLERPCGGQALCGRCRVRVADGAAAVTAADRRMLAPDELAAGWRLGCHLTLAGDCAIEVPPEIHAVPPKSFGPEIFPAASIEPQVPTGLVAPGCSAVGVAVDLGSTSLAAALVDLRDGRVLATTSRLNPQARFGADVISRISFAQQHADGNAQLHEAIVGAVGGMIGDLAVLAGVSAGSIVAVTCAGNATMTHAAVGADVTPLGEAPYLGSFVSEQELPAARFGWPIHPAARVRFVPMIRSHVGGDTVAGILACDIDLSAGWRLLVDLGTNAEVVIGGRDRIVATSTAAGPAFDGGNISCGMRAEPGAIDAVRVRQDGRLVVSTIDGQPARGVCGSGLVDAVAELFRAGVIEPSGYLCDAEQCLERGVSAALADRIITLPEGTRAVRLADTVTLGAQDIRQLQLAKGAIAAGTSLLLRRLGLAADDLDEVLVAGTFGAFLRKESLLSIGLVPRVDPERLRFVGDAAGAGARLILVDAGSRRRAMDISRRSEYVELAGDPDFEAAFCEGIPFAGGA